MNKSFNSNEICSLRLKNIKQARAINHYQKKRKLLSTSLTDKRFEKHVNDLNEFGEKLKNKKLNSAALKSEIQIATRQALRSIHSSSLPKENWNLRSFRKTGWNLYTSHNSPVLTERTVYGNGEFSSSFLELTPKRRGRLEEMQRWESKENFKEIGLGDKGQESVFIDKIKQATLKLREMRKKLHMFH